MIRKLSLKDNKQLMDYLLEEKAMNLFIIGDVENFGYDNDFQELWAEYTDSGNIKAVLLRYYHSYIVYAKETFDIQGFVAIIKQDAAFEVLSGKKELIEQFSTLIDVKMMKEMYFAACDNDHLLDKNIDRLTIQKATIDDVEAIFELRNQIEEFHITASSKESYKHTLATGTGRTYMIKEGDKVVSSASTTAENSHSVMVVGVSTHPAHRQKGYASLCMTALCQDIIDEGRTLCLFYDNPAAGAIYKRLGFKDIGKWFMYQA